MQKVLFVLKKRGLPYQQTEEPSEPSYTNSMSSGLANSIKFCNDMLNQNGFNSKMVEVIDNNSIDCEVHLFKPDIVIIEALWVVPHKFHVLHKLHPHVKWIVRIHSELPFISNEGNAMGWLTEYVNYPNVYVAANTVQMTADLKRVVSEGTKFGYHDHKVLLLPNYYGFNHSDFEEELFEREDDTLNISCFGAIRPLKNQLIQAIAAIEFAKRSKKKLKFHINASRVEQGNNVLKNIRQLFDSLDEREYKLVEHGWLSHHKFLQVIRNMDVAMQVSFSETYNLVTADAVSQNVPVVVSSEIYWISKIFQAKTTDVNDIVRKLDRAIRCKRYCRYANIKSLQKYNKNAIKDWKETLSIF